MELLAQSLKHKYEHLAHKDSRNTPYEELIGLLRTMTTPEAMGILSRLQAGDDVEVILNAVKAGSLLLQLRMAPVAGLRHNHPYSPEMPP